MTAAASGPLIALTGATGFLGSHIADLLLDGGYRVRASVRRTSDLRWLADKPVERLTVDLGDPAACRRLVEGADGVVHCAGVVSAADESTYIRANVDTTASLLAMTEKAASPRTAFVLVSSLAAHGPAGLDAPAREDDDCRPVTAYGRSKLAAEELVLAPGRWRFRTAVLRPPALYGPRDRAFLPLVRMALKGWTGWFGRMEAISMVDGRDAAAAAVALLKAGGSTGAYFVDDGQRGYDRAALAAALSEMAGRRVRAVGVPMSWLRLTALLTRGWRPGGSSLLSEDRMRDLDTPGWVCDGGRLVRETGFRAVHRAGDGLRDTLAFYREHGWL